jgi:hypothetical protein
MLKKIHLVVRIPIFNKSYNHPSGCYTNEYYINGYGFHVFSDFLARDSLLRFQWARAEYKGQKGGSK